VKSIIKLNASILLSYIFAATVTAYFYHGLLEQNAHKQVSYQAELLLDQIDSIRTYTVEEIRPLTKQNNLDYASFHPQSVPAYAATKIASDFSAKRPEYSYKEAVINPTNIRDRAAPWEVAIIEQFKLEQAEDFLSGTRWVEGVKSLYIAKPIQILNEACLECHSTPEAAPTAMIDKYGNKNGFGWKLGEVVGTRMLIVPFSLPSRLANNTFSTFIYILAGILFAILLAFNVTYFWMRRSLIKQRQKSS